MKQVVEPAERGIRNGKNPGEGFTLIEVMIAVFLLAVALIGLASVTTTVIKSTEYSQTLTTATTLAKDKIEDLKASPYGDIASGSDTSGIFNRSWTVTSSASPSDYKTIVVTVTWNWQGQGRSVELRTIRARD